ncbi:hypothetical protein CBM2585_A60002 [Cupriavidus taiwanensis]|nr:hypothetical protein CBM2585_A60002 [Cupriavidus taiwanensis]
MRVFPGTGAAHTGSCRDSLNFELRSLNPELPGSLRGLYRFIFQRVRYLTGLQLDQNRPPSRRFRPPQSHCEAIWPDDTPALITVHKYSMNAGLSSTHIGACSDGTTEGTVRCLVIVMCRVHFTRRQLQHHKGHGQLAEGCIDTGSTTGCRSIR